MDKNAQELIEFVQLAEQQGYTREEALKLLVKHGLITDDPDDMD